MVKIWQTNKKFFGKRCNTRTKCVFACARERERENLITPANVKFLQILAAPSYTTNTFISYTRAIYQVKSLQELRAPSNFKKGIVTYLLAEQQC